MSSQMSNQVELTSAVSVQQPPLHECVKAVVQQHIASFSGRGVRNLYDIVITEMEQVLIEQVLDYTGGNESRTAKILGISRGTLRQRRRKFGHYDTTAIGQ